jgi:hypothetical protein
VPPPPAGTQQLITPEDSGDIYALAKSSGGVHHGVDRPIRVLVLTIVAVA